jgi:aryl-alcohol dehydrogenase-like predicted oxidoreductase
MQTKQTEKRKLGNSGLKVAPLIFGGNVFGWTVKEEAASELLDRFVDSGFNMIDTADVYSNWIPGNHGGESESIIGKWLKQSGKRDRVLIATKVGLDMGNGREGLSRKHILRSADESLARLQTDHVDLYQSHTEDKQTPQEETLEAYAELIEVGKVRAIGASNFQPATLQAALKVSREKSLPRYESLQPEYNLYERAKFEVVS